METTDTPSPRSTSRLALRQRVVLSLIVAMLLITLGAEAEALLREARGLVSLVWPMALLALAIYWLRVFLRGWMQRFGIGECCEYGDGAP